MNRAQRESDRRKLIADLDAALAREAALNETNTHLRRIVGERDSAYQRLLERIRVVRDQLIGVEGASLDEVSEALDAIIRPTFTLAMHRTVDDHQQGEGLHLIRQHTGGGTA